MLKIFVNDKKTKIRKEVQLVKTLNGDYVLKEHPDIDIIVMPAKNKILALPKEEYSDKVYSIQDQLFSFLSKKGVILPESISGGNIYGSLQALYPQDPPGGENPLEVVVFTAASFIEQQRPIFKFEKEFEDKMENSLLLPDVEASTELGEVPQEQIKGSIPKQGFPTRGIYRYNY